MASILSTSVYPLFEVGLEKNWTLKESFKDRIPKNDSLSIQDFLNQNETFAPRCFTKEQEKKFGNLNIDNFISKKYIAHLFGDSFLEDSPHVGWFIGDALIHMIEVLRENQISAEVTQVLKDIENCFTWQGRYMSLLYHFEDIESAQSHENQVKEEICEKIKELDVGQKIVVPGGYKGHSVLYEVKRTSDEEYEFAVYNTGDGTYKHWMIIEKEGVHKIQGVYRIRKLALENIVDSSVLQKLIHLKVEEPDDFGVELYENILSELKGEREDAPHDIESYMQSQRSGTCVWKMLCAYLRYNLPLSQYKYLKLKARLDIFEKWYTLGYPLDFHKTNQRLLNRLVVNFERIFYKRDTMPIEFSRKELLVLGLLKVQKTFNRYKFLLSMDEIKRTENWYTHFTGQSIYEDNGYVIRRECEKEERRLVESAL